ncbi:class I SAM-dependent methyltransferase [Endozoicomonas arenosclerae]|uniref:class I SAM-dependent methyltransferase n=1 Tax=Endozoicomonas arenosclerae TaxID=1633495 RepID=UPI000781253C|nr:class I SAM-dependent methyltransferase [Endozoicomonas arenosclerae]
MTLYNPDHIKNYYNEYADKETERWNTSIVEQVKLLIHNHYLSTHMCAGDKVLELGAGTGVFTQPLSDIAGHLVVTDLSPVQLGINQSRAQELDYADKVNSWQLADITDLSQFEDHSFDKIVCYGGPLSYVFDQRDQALSEIRRVLKPEGTALLSVMNLWGSIDQYLEPILATVSESENFKIVRSGNLHPSSHAVSDHHCHMFRAEQLTETFERNDFEIITLSASNCISSKRPEALEEIRQDSDKWQHFLKLEIEACASPGMVESGSHMIAVLKKA